MQSVLLILIVLILIVGMLIYIDKAILSIYICQLIVRDACSRPNRTQAHSRVNKRERRPPPPSMKKIDVLGKEPTKAT